MCRGITTGEVIYITDEEVRAAEDETPLDQFPQWQHEAIRVAKDFLESGDYLPLPTKFDIHEYRIMERFCRSVGSMRRVHVNNSTSMRHAK